MAADKDFELDDAFEFAADEVLEFDWLPFKASDWLLPSTNQINKELEENPYDADLILKKYASPLEEIARLAVMKDLKHLEEEFLQLNPEEVGGIVFSELRFVQTRNVRRINDC